MMFHIVPVPTSPVCHKQCRTHVCMCPANHHQHTVLTVSHLGLPCLNRCH